MKEYIPKDKVLELWRYWKFIEAYDDTKAMKGIDLDDYVPREWYDRVCEEMAKHYMRHKMLDDGTLVASVDDATKATRVLVEDEKKDGDLYYADRPKGEWIDNGDRYFRCSLCGTKDTDTWDWCHGCGAQMKGTDDE